MKLFCVFQKDYLIGRFRSKKEAINYLIDCWFDGMENVYIRVMTPEEYEKWVQEEKKKWLDKI